MSVASPPVVRAISSPSPVTSTSLPRAERFRFVDALRGLAALGVCCYHIERYGPLQEPAAELLPGWFRLVVTHGWVGVQMFFVISGFVIAYSVGRARITPRFLGTFALRRSLRLDPPYWTIIFVALLLHSLPAWLNVPTPHESAPSTAQVLAHVFYVQNILGYDNLSAGFWTLCIEMQLYLSFILLLGVVQRLAWDSSGLLLLVFAPLGLLSLFVFNLDPQSDDWAHHFCCMFGLGAIVWWALEGRVPRWTVWATLLAFAARLAWNWGLDILIAALTGLAIYLAGRTGHLSDWLNVRGLQALGRVSYSLYLVHYPVSHVVVNLGYRATGTDPYWAVFWLILAVALSLAAAQLLYVCVEGPSLRLAARFKRSSALRQAVERASGERDAPPFPQPA